MPKKFRYPIVIVILLFLAIPSPILATELITAPFYIRNQSPIIQIFGLPPAEGGQITPPGRTKLRLVLDISNNYTVNKSANESLLFDGEASRVTFSLRHGFADRWEAGIDIPIVSHNGGMLDGLIENWHNTFGLPQGGRDDVLRNRLHYSYREDGKNNQLNFSNSGTGLGDTTLYLTYQLTHDPASQRYLVLRGGVKLPTGSTENLRGSGGTDVHIRLAVSDGETLKRYNVSLFGSLGLLWLEKGDILRNKQRQKVGFCSVGVGWEALNWQTLKLQIDGHSQFFEESQLKQLDSSSAQLAIGGAIKLSEQLVIDLCVVEDIIVDTAPDVTFHTALTYLY